MTAVLFDVTQYASWPATSGIQRVLLQLATRWSHRRLEAKYGVLDGDSFAVGQLSTLSDVMMQRFSSSETSALEPRSQLLAQAESKISWARLRRHFDAYFLPEPSLDPGSVSVAQWAVRSARSPTAYFLHFDALPLTHPHCFPRETDGFAFTRYCRSMVGANTIAFISNHARGVFETRVARTSVTLGIVARPGADGLPTHRRNLPRTPLVFAAVGTIEPRKRYDHVLDAFEDLWARGRDYNLVIAGKRGWRTSSTVARIEALAGNGRVQWHETATDAQVAATLASSTALIAVPEAEGFGIPALEALAAGCPAIVSADLPSLEGISDAGQIRLSSVEPRALADAIDAFADSGRNAAARTALQEIRLPTWEQFVNDIETWMEDTMPTRKARS